MPQFSNVMFGDHATAAAPSWIWEGYVARGQITLFTAMWKSGKTTLLAHLLSKRKEGGELLGQVVAAGRTIVVSEEAAMFWSSRHRLLDFGDAASFVLRPFMRSPTRTDWESLLSHVLGTCKEQGADLVILDPIATLMPAQIEGDAARALDALQALRRLTEAGVAVLLVHHPRKATSKAGATARGSGVLSSFVDIILEMYSVRPDDPAHRQRRLLGFSRDAATPRSRLIELSADMTAYVIAEEAPPDDWPEWEAVCLALEAADHPLTRAEIIEQWPTSFPCPKSLTLWRRLDAARDRGWVRREGAGTRSDPHRYFLPEVDGRAAAT